MKWTIRIMTIRFAKRIGINNPDILVLVSLTAMILLYLFVFL